MNTHGRDGDAPSDSARSGRQASANELPTPTLDDDHDLADALRALSGSDPALARLLRAGLAPRVRRRPAGFAGLVRIIVAQQVSTASAAATWSRVEAAFTPLTPDRILAATEPDLRAPGLSRPKVRALRSVAAAVESGRLPLDELPRRDADWAHARLCAVSGIGPWTADIYLMFCLGHADAFAAGDLALQEAVRDIDGLPARPDARALRSRAELWRPWRSAAAHLLWEHYRVTRSRDGVLAAPARDTGA